MEELEKEKTLTLYQLYNLKMYENRAKEVATFIHQNNREPQKSIREEKDMADWLQAQKSKYNHDKLSTERKQIMQKYGISLTGAKTRAQIESLWTQTADEYFGFVDTEKREPIRDALDKHESDLARWASTQRRAFCGGLMKSSRKIYLAEHGFNFRSKSAERDAVIVAVRNK